ncbi:MFS transporter [Pseudohyphozyma bogoriensis]|nr:MFS transporter [Pseudohyphozyma bogoriensis]
MGVRAAHFVGGYFQSFDWYVCFAVIPDVADDLKVSEEAVNLSVTFYMIMQGISPTVWGSLCDCLGRRPLYIITFLIYLGASIGLANTHSYGLLVALRIVQSAGSASVIAIGAGSIGAMLGPALGPVVGGIIADAYGWQSLFWFLTAFGGVVFILIILVLPETLRSLVGNGSIPPPPLNRTVLSIIRARRHRNDPVDPSTIPAMPPKKGWKDLQPLAPFRMFKEKDVLLVLTFNAIVYTLFYTVITSTASAFKATYHLGETALGLCLLANGCGCIVAALVNGPTMNRDYRIVKQQVEQARLAQSVEAGDETTEKKRRKAKTEDLSNFPIEKARLRSLPWFYGVLCASTITYGWTLDKGVYLAVPLICQFFIGLCVTTMFNSFSTLLVDMFPGSSASATAANNIYRCLMGAAGTAFIDPLISALGAGWTFTMLTLITICFTPLILLEWKYGMRIRKARAERVREEERRRKEAEGK